VKALGQKGHLLSQNGQLAGSCPKKPALDLKKIADVKKIKKFIVFRADQVFP